MSDIQGKDRENFKAFQEKLPKLKNLRGKHFLMRHGKIVYYYNSYNDAYSTGAAVYGDGQFSVFLLKDTAKRSRCRKRHRRKNLGRGLGLLRGACRISTKFPDITETTLINHPRTFRWCVVGTTCALSHFILAPAPGGGSVLWQRGSMDYHLYWGRARTGWFNGYRLTEPWCI